MALLFAHLEHQVRRTAVTVGRAIVEKVTGFANFDAAKYLLADTDPDDTKSCRATDTLDCLGCDWYGNCEWPPATVPAGSRCEGTSPAGLSLGEIVGAIVAPLVAERIDELWLGPAGLAANERIAAALRVAEFKAGDAK